jgi:F420H(2)-dependent quinone reductase
VSAAPARLRTRAVARLLNLPTRFPRLENVLTRRHADTFRRSRGRLLGRWVGAPVMLIETVGRRTGEARRTPIIYVAHGDAFVVTPANAGSPRTPAWWLNLKAAGAGTVILGDRRIPVRARVTTGEERARLWDLFVSAAPAVGVYPTFTDREFPIVALEPYP